MMLFNFRFELRQGNFIFNTRGTNFRECSFKCLMYNSLFLANFFSRKFMKGDFTQELHEHQK